MIRSQRISQSSLKRQRTYIALKAKTFVEVNYFMFYADVVKGRDVRMDVSCWVLFCFFCNVSFSLVTDVYRNCSWPITQSTVLDGFPSWENITSPYKVGYRFHTNCRHCTVSVFFISPLKCLLWHQFYWLCISNLLLCLNTSVEQNESLPFLK